jgi:hypothetical protein
MKWMHLLLIVLNMAFALYSKPGKIIPGLNTPNYLHVDKDRLIIAENASFSIYSKEDMKLRKKVDKTGQGPGEFVVRPGMNINVAVSPEYIIVNDISKMLFFTKEGEYVKEIRKSNPNSIFEYWQEMIIGKTIKSETGIDYIDIGFFNKELTSIKELFKVKNSFQARRIENGFNPLTQDYIKMRSSKDKIYINDEEGNIIAFDRSGKQVFVIDRTFEKVPVTSQHKERINAYYKEQPGIRPIFEGIKQFMRFPEFFPKLRDYFVTDSRLYVVPYEKDPGNSNIYVFDNNGAFKEKRPLKLKEKNIFEFYPYCIHDGKLYQLVENDNEEWELVIEKI